MAIQAFAIPSSLSWSNYTITSHRIQDPHDGQLQDCVTNFEWFLTPNLQAVQQGNQFRMNASMRVEIKPNNCRVWSGANKTAALLSHEQFHYDVPFAIARVVASKLNSLRAPSISELRRKIAEITLLHFTTRNELIQKRYDIDTRHSTNARYQRIWKNRMTTVLADPQANQIGGFWL
ncbi:MAG: hypothetical protein GY748_00620 [Planctomycetaceae bacterium]|nr:hypothetical protein [Planctomycetaceae bacterium]